MSALRTILDPLSRWWHRLQDAVVQDMPAELEACEDCRVTDCTQQQWQQCARRLAALAERNGLDLAVPVLARTDEMPAVSSDAAAAASSEAPAATGSTSDALRIVR
jgi:hypothetical protein